VRDWLEQDIERAVVLLLQAEQDPAPFVAVAHAQGHDLAALSFSTLDELTLVVANGLLKAEGPRHAPLLKVAPLQSSEFSPGSPAVLRGRFVPDPVALPTLQSGVWVVHLPEEEAVEDAELDGAADVEPPLWIYVLGLALSIPVIVLMKAKGKL
jgi:hypothetical protein